MKLKLYLAALLASLTAVLSAQTPLTPCEGGMAGDYPCDQVDLYSTLTLEDLGGVQNMNDIWGWTDSESGREFALVGLRNGTTFVEVTDPLNPLVLGFLATATNNSLWRDIKVFNDYAFIVSEAGGHGMQVFDLNKLLVDPTDLTGTFEHDAWYQEFGNAHNIVMNEETGYAYGVGTNTFSGGLHVVDVNDPLNPEIAGGFSADGYTHDAQVLIYNGPDADYAGHEIAFACNEDEVSIIDVTDKTDMFLISSIQYPFTEYMHQGWVSDDLHFFIANDELDERDQEEVVNTRSLIFDIEDLDNPFLHQEFDGEATSIDHNLYNRGSLSYQSNYTSGLRILDIGNIYEQDVAQVGFFDCQPNTDVTEFFGTWSNYCYFESGTIIMTDMYTDFFILRPTIVNAYRYSKVCGNADQVSYYIDATWDANITNATAGSLPAGVSVEFGELVSPGVISVTATLSEILAEGEYDLPITFESNGVEIFSEDLRLIVDNGEDLDFSNLLPENGFVADDFTVDLSWNETPGISDYTLTISASEDMSEVVTSEVLSETSYSFEGQGTFYWTISAVGNQCGLEAFSEVNMFQNNYAGIVGLNVPVLNIFPNPANSELTVTGVSGMIEVYSIDGKLVLTQNLSQNRSVQVADLSGGIYVLKSVEHGIQTSFIKE